MLLWKWMESALSMIGKLKLSMLSGASQMKGQVSHFKEILNQKNSRIEAVKVAKFTKSPK